MVRNTLTLSNLFISKLILSATLLGIAFNAYSLTPQTQETSVQHYIFGIVPQFHAREIERIWKPILKEIHKRSGVSLKILASPNIPEFEKQFEEGQYHFAYMNPYHALVANRTQSYQPLLRDIRKQLKGIIVVRQDSPILKIEQLDSKKLALPAPNALGASLLPRAELATIYKIEPNITYVNSHNSVYLNVVTGQADAGAGVIATLNRQLPKIRNKLRIIYKTQGVSPHPLMVHPDVPEEIAKRVQDALLELGQTKNGRALLAKIPIKKIGIATLEDYAQLIKLGLDNFYVKNVNQR